MLGLGKGNKFLLGDAVTWADLAVVSLLEFVSGTVYDGKLSESNATLGAYVERVQALPGIKEYIAGRPASNL